MTRPARVLCAVCGRGFTRENHEPWRFVCDSCLVPKYCTCQTPIRCNDEVGRRCLRCGKRLDSKVRS